MEEEAGEPRDVVLVVGSAFATKDALVQRLCGSCVRATEDWSGPAGVVSQYEWTLNTKYYTAPIRFWVCSAEASAAPDAASLGVFAKRCDALILVVDTTSNESPAYFSKWIHFIEECAPSILLCVGQPSEAQGDACRADVLSRFQEWCVEHAVEWVYVGSAAAGCGEVGEEEGEAHGLGMVEKRGYDRVEEALQAHVWATMQTGPATSRPQPTMIPPAPNGGAKQSCPDPAVLRELVDAGPQKPLPSAGTDNPMAALEALMMKGEGGATKGFQEDVDALASQSDWFEEAVETVSSIRSQAMALPDDERRAVAERFALFMYNMMTDGDEGEEAGDGDDAEGREREDQECDGNEVLPME